MKFNFHHLYWLVIMLLLFTNLAFFLENQKNIDYAKNLSSNWREYRFDLVSQVCDVNLLVWKEEYDHNRLLESLDNGFDVLEKFGS